VEIKQLCQQSTLNVTQDITRSMRDLEAEVVSTGNIDHIKDLKSKKSALTDLLGTQAQGALVRSRFMDAALMDAPSKFFFGLEKNNWQSRVIHAICSESGQEIRDANGIRRRVVSFYSELYSDEYIDNNEFFQDFCGGLPKVPEEVNASLEGPLVAGELYAALQGMEGGKAPGIYGIP